MSQKFPLLLFAAGHGTRMGKLGKEKPKCLIEVGGKALLDHALAQTENEYVSRKVANLHYKKQMIKDHLQQSDVAFSVEDERALETGGGLRHARDILGQSPAITLNTDAVWSNTSAIKTLAQNWRDDMQGLLLLVPKSRAIGHPGKGDFSLGEDGRLSRDADFVYTGAQIIRTDTLDRFPSDVFSMNVVWDQMLAENGLFGVVYDGTWCDLGQPESIAPAEDMIRRTKSV